MKTVLDYLKENKKFEGTIGKANIKLEMFEDLLVVTRDTHIHTRKVSEYYDAEEFISDILEEHKIEVRFCEECGKPYDAGYTAGDGDWYCCEECFEGVMNRDYGEGKWRGTNEEGDNGGFYEYLNDDGEWEDTGAYWTEWND